MPILRSAVRLPDGSVPYRVEVRVETLAASSTPRNDASDHVVAGTSWAPWDAVEGTWSITLPGTDTLSSGSYYRVTEVVYDRPPNAHKAVGSSAYTCDLPSSGGPYWVVDRLLDPPAAGAANPYIRWDESGALAPEIANPTAGDDGKAAVYDHDLGRVIWSTVAGGGGASTLDQLTDVTATGAATGAVLRKSAGDWTAQTLTASDVGADAAGTASAAVAALSSVYQPLDSDLTAIAALTTTAYGRAFLALADAAAARTAMSLGSLATLSTITSAEITDGTITPTDLNATARIVTGVIAVRSGTLTAETAAASKTPRWYNRTGRTITITACHASVDTPPTGSAVTVAVRRNGGASNDATITISAAASTGSATGLSITVADGDYLQAWPTAIGSSTAGSDLSVSFVGSYA